MLPMLTFINDISYLQQEETDHDKGKQFPLRNFSVIFLLQYNLFPARNEQEVIATKSYNIYT